MPRNFDKTVHPGEHRKQNPAGARLLCGSSIQNSGHFREFAPRANIQPFASGERLSVTLRRLRIETSSSTITAKQYNIAPVSSRPRPIATILHGRRLFANVPQALNASEPKIPKGGLKGGSISQEIT